VAETSDDVGPSEDEEATDEEATDPEATAEDATGEDVTTEEAADESSESITELLGELGRDVAALFLRETQLAIVRNPRAVRRAVRDVAGALVAGLALVTAFVFGNVAALDGLRTVMSLSLAALVLGGAWLAIGSALALALSVRAGRVTGFRWWHVGRADRQDSLQQLERARGEAEQAVVATLGRLTPAVTVEIASAVASGTVGEVVEAGGDILEAGGDILEASDDIVEDLTENLPAGSVVNQMWDVVLMPGRLGVKVATTVFKRSDSRDG
jgi:hypothetical protein